MRCIFHGRKIDVAGKVTDVPAEGARSAAVAASVKLNAYPTWEAGGLIWVFLGQGEVPAFPDLPFCAVSDDHVWMTRSVIPCNWVQGLEAALDSSHVGHLHISWVSQDDQGEMLSVPSDYDVENTAYGMRASTMRATGNGTALLRVLEYIAPFITFVPGSPTEDGREAATFIAVPVDDTNHLLFWGLWNEKQPMSNCAAFFTSEAHYDLYNFARFSGSQADNWNQDRTAMKAGHGSGFTQVLLQEDMVVQMSMGPIVDRSREHLCRADIALAGCRQILLKLADRYETGGKIDGSYPNHDASMYPIGAVVAEDYDWRSPPLAAQ